VEMSRLDKIAHILAENWKRVSLEKSVWCSATCCVIIPKWMRNIKIFAIHNGLCRVSGLKRNIQTCIFFYV